MEERELILYSSYKSYSIEEIQEKGYENLFNDQDWW